MGGWNTGLILSAVIATPVAALNIVALWMRSRKGPHDESTAEITTP